MKKVLITGARGFIGRHCLPSLLAANFDEVHAVSSQVATKIDGDVRWHQADLLDNLQASKLLSKVKPTHLLHFAWYAKPGEYWTSPENRRWLVASQKLLAEFAAQGGARFVGAGTCAEYDWSYGVLSERKTPLAPQSVYGENKRALQQTLDAEGKRLGISTAWGRIFFLYGPHEYPQRLVSSVILSLLHDQPALCTLGHQRRDFLHVQDVADAFVALLQSDVTGPVNIASGEAVMVKEIVERIAHKLDREGLLRLGARPLSPNEPPLLVADVARLKDEVGWYPRYGLERGLEQTISWWRTSGE